MYSLLLFLAAYLPFQIALNLSEGIDLASVRVLVLLAFLLWLAEGLRNKKLINSYPHGSACYPALLPSYPHPQNPPSRAGFGGQRIILDA